jgi:hypothetical protein
LRQQRRDPATVSILTYYQGQAEIILTRLGSVPGLFPLLRFGIIGSIDQMQGLESDFVFVSFCRASNAMFSPAFGGFLREPARLRISLTQARRTLILVGHGPRLLEWCMK